MENNDNFILDIVKELRNTINRTMSGAQRPAMSSC